MTVKMKKKILFGFLLQLFLLKVVKVGDLSLCLQGCNLEQLFSEFSHVELVHREWWGAAMLCGAHFTICAKLINLLLSWQISLDLDSCIQGIRQWFKSVNISSIWKKSNSMYSYDENVCTRIICITWPNKVCYLEKTWKITMLISKLSGAH